MTHSPRRHPTQPLTSGPTRKRFRAFAKFKSVKVPRVCLLCLSSLPSSPMILVAFPRPGGVVPGSPFGFPLKKRTCDNCRFERTSIRRPRQRVLSVESPMPPSIVHWPFDFRSTWSSLNHLSLQPLTRSLSFSCPRSTALAIQNDDGNLQKPATDK